MAKGKRFNSGKLPKKKATNDEKDKKEKKEKKEKKRINSVPKSLILDFGQKKEYSVKKKLIPLKDLNIKPEKHIDKMNIKEIKKFASLFDLNPEINFKLLKYLKNNSRKDYDHFIEKYKYTLDFKDALILDCFKKEEIELTQKEFFENAKNLKLNYKEIKSLSKIKLFNLFFYILFKKLDNSKDIYIKIRSYCIPISLIFKVPNRFGNIELNYYSYLTFFINFFTSEIRNYEDQEEKNEKNDDSSNEVYFNWDSSITGETEKINLTDINERRKKFDNFIDTNYIEVENETSKTSIKPKKTEAKSNLIERMYGKIYRFRFFKEKIIEIFSEPDDIILQKIKFIFYCQLFPNEEMIDSLSVYSKCLRGKPYSNDEIDSNIFISKCYDIDKNCIKNKYELFALENLDNNFSRTIKNPFNYNSKYYSFPTLLKKNIIDNDRDISRAFVNYLKYIYSSNIIKDIFYLTPEFEEFIYPLEDERIFNELMEYTIFMPLEGDDLHGFTQKEIPEVLISVRLQEIFPQETQISRIICELSQILNTCIHEQLKHYIKSLIFYNSFRFNLKKRIGSDLYNYGKEDRYINGILYIMKNKNKYYEIDGGHKAEIFLYGDILNKIFFPQALELFKKSNWNKEIAEHIKSFNNANKKIKDSFQTFTINEIYFNDDFCEFFKIFIKKFIETVAVRSKDSIVFDNNASASRKPAYIQEKAIKNEITFDYNCYINIKGNYMKDSSL